MSGPQSDGPPRPTFPLPPARNLGLRDGASEVELGARADVSRVLVETGSLAQIVGQRGVGETGWGRIRAELWERSLREAQLLPLLAEIPAETPSTLASQLRQLRDRLQEVRALEERLGEDAEEEGTVGRREHDGTVVVLCVAGLLTALAPAEIRPFLAAGFTLYGFRVGARRFSPKAKVGREQLADARRALGRALQSFLEHTWVAAVGDRILESTPHAIYLHHRLMDLDAARGAGEARARELRGLMSRIRQANQSLGRDQDDPEIARLQQQLDEVQGRLAQIDRLRADCASRAEAHNAQLERQRAIAARRALSSRVSNLVSAEGEDAALQQIAVIEVDIADLAARIRGLDVEIGSADAELRSVLEVSGVGAPALRGAATRKRTAS